MSEEKKGKPPEISVHTGQITHKEFAKSNGKFKKACESAGMEPTERQASKWRRRMGKAWKSK